MTAENEEERIVRLTVCRLKGHRIASVEQYKLKVPFCFTCFFGGTFCNAETILAIEKSPSVFSQSYFENHFNWIHTNTKDCNENRKKE